MRFLRCFSKYSLCTASTVLTVLSESRVVLVNPHLPTSFVVHSDRQDGNGIFGSRFESVCHTNTSVFFGVCFSGEKGFLGECFWEERRRERRFFSWRFFVFLFGMFFG